MNKAENIVESKWLSPDDLFRIYEIAKATQAQYRIEKKIPYSKIGRRIFYSREKIDQWIENAKVN
jgi:hypothetical protein